MSDTSRMRGQPLVALLALITGWLGARVMSWDAQAFAIPEGRRVADMADAPQQDAGQGFWYDARTGPVSQPAMPVSTTQAQMAEQYGLAAVPQGYPAAYPVGYQLALGAPAPVRMYYQDRAESLPAPGGGYLKNAVFLPGTSAGDFPATLPPLASLMAQPYAGGGAALPPQRAAARPRRWSADAWAMMRKGANGALPNGMVPSTYGGNQAGAVLRYRLSLTNPHRPTVYIRTTSSTGMIRETAAALGLSARPVASIPVIAALEARMVDQGGRRLVQPVAMAVTELPPFRLPWGFRGEAYAQAGYVAGKFATPFADGQLRADRKLLTIGPVETRIGGGVWGGIQKGAGRLDAGPGLTASFPLGKGVSGRAALDWRFRVAGDSLPGSGPTVTLSAGF